MTKKTKETASESRTAVYLFYTPEGEFIYVSADRETYALQSYKLFIGRGRVLREVLVDSIDKRNDGGTIFIRTAEGVLFSPSPRKTAMEPSWRRTQLVKVDMDKFVISESAKGARIAPKKVAKPSPDVEKIDKQ